MNLPKYTLILALTAWCTFPLSAQSAKDTSQTQETSIPQTTSQSQAFHQNCYCNGEPLSTRELIEAEEELAHIRSTQDNHATFESYPYLLNPAYRRNKRTNTCPCRAHDKQASPVSTAQNDCANEEDPLDERELIEAEEELAHIRSTQDNHATFESYPYLLNPAYRRGNEQTRQQILQNFEREKRLQQSVRARKIGL